MGLNLSGAQWFTSSRSSAGKECVEVAFLDRHHIAVRDSKNPQGPVLTFTLGQWDAFTTAISSGLYDRRELPSP
ncbi:hypothetical protein CJ469_04864 [Nocardia farcinica]|uniref:DUF397 domain-containing protein n=1 Tax=Nocardia farcinica TaxID=37329 RepID=UPI000BF350D0|nr:DUF397 domain-containing protein [Nocardia farcinica]PFW99830.1 hypothetical protein CJ469_04864 [Nocardia farcinica]PFX06289.1 hypothetical protein CJ468_04679 [Nocardia farcinica]